MAKTTWTEEQYRAWLDERPDVKRQVAGRRAKAHGDSFEQRLDAYHVGLVLAGRICNAARRYTPTKPTWYGKRLVFVATGRGQCDYAVIFRSFVGGVFDAKSCEKGKSFSWPAEQEHQLAELRELHAMSQGHCPAFALVEWNVIDSVRLHPIWTIEGRSVRMTEGCPVTGLDWLTTAETIWPHIKV